MSIMEPGSAGTRLVDRLKNLLLKPGETWAVIDTEPTDIPSLYKGWVIPLAAIPAVCGLVGMLVFGVSILGINYKPPVLGAVTQAVVNYALTLGGVYVSALIIDALAPTFGAEKNRVQAFKVAAYAPTAVWVMGVVQLAPLLSVLMLIGALYSLYLLYKGLPVVMHAPQDKALPYTAAIMVVSLVVALVIGMVSGQVLKLAGAGSMAGAGAGAGVLATPGGGSVDLGKLEAASKQMEQAAKQMEDAAQGRGSAPAATDPELLKAYLPAFIGGYTRGATSSSSGGAAGMQGSTAEGTYAKGDARITLTITDMGAAGALAAMAGAFGVQSSSEQNGRYQKLGKVDGRTTMEEYDSAAKSGSYSVFAADRYMIQAQGEQATMDELKTAVRAVDPARLEKLAKAG